MTKVLLVAAALGLTMSVAGACDFMRSAKTVDTTMTASTDVQPLSTPDMAIPSDQASTDRVLIEEEG